MTAAAERAHAYLGPSSAYKWLNCPQSARLEELIPDQTSEHAELGRLAHEFAELELTKKFKVMKPTEYKKRLSELKKNALYETEIERCVAEYIEYVSELAYQKPSMPAIVIEKLVDLSTYVPESFGTADCILISGTDLHVIDYKHGKGVLVNVENNPQLMLYGLGALDLYKRLYTIDTVHLAVIQPRAGGISEWSLSATVLLEWGESIKEAALNAFNGTGEAVPGDWCQKGFCRAAGQCAAQVQIYSALADQSSAGTDPDLLSVNEIGETLSRLSGFVAWLKKLEAVALQKCLAGEEVPGWKAVEGRSNRVIRDENIPLVEKAIVEAGTKKTMLYKRSFLGITELEALIGKKELEALVGELIEKPPGKPTLAAESDRRPAITNQQSIENMFGTGE